MPWMWVLVIGAAGAGGIAAAYYALPHVAGRINRFISGEGDNFQTETALEAIVRGGWAGRGPGEGTVKRILPDSHTDFIFAVAAEEYGIAVMIVLVCVFAFVVLRGLWHALELDDPFCRIATAGLVSLFGMQTAINLGVNLSLLPAKGMTLPFVSYGGTSMIAVAFGMGLVLALSRRRPRSQALAEVERQRRAPPTATPSAA
jgi:cell division protein FtsW